MEKIKNTLISVMLILCSLAVFSCSDDDKEEGEEGRNENKQTLLVGKWENVLSEGYEIGSDGKKDYYSFPRDEDDGYVIFMENGTYKGVAPDEEDETGTWSYNEKTMTLTVSETGGKTESVKLLKLTATEFVWEESTESAYWKTTFRKIE